MLIGSWPKLLLNLIVFDHANTQHRLTYCSHRNTAWCFQCCFRYASLSLFLHSVFMSTFKSDFKKQLNQMHHSHNIPIQLLHPENEIQTQDLICIEDQGCSHLLESWKFSAVLLHVRAIIGSKSSWRDFTEPVTDLGIDCYYYYTAVEIITEHDYFLIPDEHLPSFLCSHLHPLPAIKSCRETAPSINGLHQLFVLHLNCQRVHLIKYFRGSGQKEKRKSAKDLLLGCQEIAAPVWGQNDKRK